MALIERNLFSASAAVFPDYFQLFADLVCRVI